MGYRSKYEKILEILRFKSRDRGAGNKPTKLTVSECNDNKGSVELSAENPDGSYISFKLNRGERLELGHALIDGVKFPVIPKYVPRQQR